MAFRVSVNPTFRAHFEGKQGNPALAKSSFKAPAAGDNVVSSGRDPVKTLPPDTSLQSISKKRATAFLQDIKDGRPNNS